VTATCDSSVMASIAVTLLFHVAISS